MILLLLDLKKVSSFLAQVSLNPPAPKGCDLGHFLALSSALLSFWVNASSQSVPPPLRLDFQRLLRHAPHARTTLVLLCQTLCRGSTGVTNVLPPSNLAVGQKLQPRKQEKAVAGNPLLCPKNMCPAMSANSIVICFPLFSCLCFHMPIFQTLPSSA